MEKKHPLKSRKFWVTIIALVVSILAYYFPPEKVETAEKIAMMILNVACALGYVVTEGKVDKVRAKRSSKDIGGDGAKTT